MRKVQQIAYAREAAKVRRCHTFPIVGEYTTGSHSYDALSLYLLLCPKPTMAAIWEIQFHDSAERIVGDMPAPVKSEWIDLGSWYEHVEMEVRRSFGLNNPHEMTDEDRSWVNACDKLEFLLFCMDQKELGNVNVNRRRLIIEKSLRNAKLPSVADAFFRYVVNKGLPKIQDDMT